MSQKIPNKGEHLLHVFNDPKFMYTLWVLTGVAYSLAVGYTLTTHKKTFANPVRRPSRGLRAPT